VHDHGIADSDIFYFVIMVRHGVHVIFTQMVSTHEAMVQGTLDFPNLISLKNITQDFVIDVEIYGMVSCLSFLFISCLFTLWLSGKTTRHTCNCNSHLYCTLYWETEDAS